MGSGDWFKKILGHKKSKQDRSKKAKVSHELQWLNTSLVWFF